MEFKKFFFYILFAFLFLHSASCDIITIKKEDDDLKIDTSSIPSSNHDGAILLQLRETNNEYNIHLKLIPKNKTIIPIQVNYKFPEINFDVVELSEAYVYYDIRSYILNREYILITFLEVKDGLLRNSGLILSWNGEITRYRIFIKIKIFLNDK